MWPHPFRHCGSWRVLHGFVHLLPIILINSSLGSDVGGSQYIIDGKIKLKGGTQIKEFTEGGLTFEDGTQLAADVVLFCTG